MPLPQCFIRWEQIVVALSTNCNTQIQYWDKQTPLYLEQPNFSQWASFQRKGFFFLLIVEIGQAALPFSSAWHFFYLLCKQCSTQGLYGTVLVTVKGTSTNYSWQVKCRESRGKQLCVHAVTQTKQTQGGQMILYKKTQKQRYTVARRGTTVSTNQRRNYEERWDNKQGHIEMQSVFHTSQRQSLA